VSAADAKIQELLSSFKGVNWNNPGSWPLVVKLVVWLATGILVVVAAYFVFIAKINTVVDVERKKQDTLLKDFEEKAFKAMNLDSYKKQLADMEEAFGALLRQLPKDTEVPSLLEDITHTGLGSGLEFKSIDLKAEQRKEFYAELPIQIEVRGDYHGFGAFVSGVAALPRIVTLHDFAISADDTKSKGRASTKKGATDSAPRILKMVLTAKTYRYSDASEAAAEEEAAGKGKKKKGKAKKSSAKGEEK
jgi:type IV pilus assembly protein PilO